MRWINDRLTLHLLLLGCHSLSVVTRNKKKSGQTFLGPIGVKLFSVLLSGRRFWTLKQSPRDQTLELNASSERGSGVVVQPTEYRIRNKSLAAWHTQMPWCLKEEEHVNPGLRIDPHWHVRNPQVLNSSLFLFPPLVHRPTYDKICVGDVGDVGDIESQFNSIFLLEAINYSDRSWCSWEQLD